jgi:hypothetical protein
MLQNGVTPQETQQTEIALRAAMLGAPELASTPPSKVFDFSPTLRAAQALETSGWKP